MYIRAASVPGKWGEPNLIIELESSEIELPM
jgi:hypothetical protein